MCWLSSAPTSLPTDPSGPGPPTVAVARDRSEVSRCASARSHSWVEPVSQHRRLQVRARRPQGDCVGDRARPAPAAAGAERASLVHQGGHRDPPTVADLTEPVRVGDARIGHVDLVELGVAGELAQRPGLHARRMHVEDEVRQPLVLRHFRIGAGEQKSPPRPVREAGPDLLPVDHPLVAVGDGRRGQPGQVRARPRFGEQLAPDVLGGREPAQQSPLHLVGLRVLTHRRSRHPVPHRVQRQRHWPARPLQDPVGYRLQATRNTKAAEPFGKVHPGQARVESRRRENRGLGPTWDRGR